MTGRNRSSLPTVDVCDECGICCRHMGYPAFHQGTSTQPPEEPWTLLPADLKDELLRYANEYRARPDGELDGPCVWFDIESRRCRHHEYRPNVCRDFRVGSRGCLDWREAMADTLL